MKNQILTILLLMATQVHSANTNPGVFKKLLGRWDCEGSVTDKKKDETTNKTFQKASMNFFMDIEGAWVVGEFEGQKGYKNKCHYALDATNAKYNQICMSSLQAFNMAEAPTLNDNDVTFTGNAFSNQRSFEHTRTFENISEKQFTLISTLSDPDNKTERVWRGECHPSK